ncbi:hypothetical protein F5878DRAFT_508464, partial [Lentinula raphanica]
MIGCAFLYRISQALSDAKECKEPFGGINMIFAGDFAQLSPVGDSSLCSHVQTERVSTTAGQNIVFGKLLWLSVKTVVLLSEIKRQEGTKNLRFVDLLSRLRAVYPDWSEAGWRNAPLIVCNNETKDALNSKMAAAFAKRSNQELHWYIAED